ncbi:DoxX family protein [Lichenicoccus sp.]|uniref:DoxX family protein n=1 Tax=Lichenicoccus sp. TaxID=2781899 RepID=UPI003D12EA20
MLRVLAAFIFLAAAAMKLLAQPMMVAEFQKVGLGQWFRYAVGLIELVGGVAVLAPRTTWIGASLLLLVDLGAFFAQVTTLHMDWIHTIVIGGILVAIIYLSHRWAR